MPQIQEQLRRAGYPGFRQDVLQEIQVKDEGALASRRNVRWMFLDGSEQSAVVLTTEFVLFETGEYTCFEDFSGALQDVLQVVMREAEPELCERIGLRFINRIVPDEGDALSAYLVEGLRGISGDQLSCGDLKVDKTFGKTETRMQTLPGAHLVIRTHEKPPGDTSLPIGIADDDVRLSMEPSERNTLFLDIDHFISSRRPFEIDSMIQDAWRLHSYAELAFRCSAAEQAMTAWGMEVRDGT